MFKKCLFSLYTVYHSNAFFSDLWCSRQTLARTPTAEWSLHPTVHGYCWKCIYACI